MRVYLVTKDDAPCCITLDEDEALASYGRFIIAGRYKHLSVLVFSVAEAEPRVVLDACQGSAHSVVSGA